MSDWLTRWQQTDEDELEGASQEEQEAPNQRQASSWPPHPQAWVRSSLRQMAQERWPDAGEEDMP